LKRKIEDCYFKSKKRIKICSSRHKTQNRQQRTNQQSTKLQEAKSVRHVSTTRKRLRDRWRCRRDCSWRRSTASAKILSILLISWQEAPPEGLPRRELSFKGLRTGTNP
jgi:hypothetical protein